MQAMPEKTRERRPAPISYRPPEALREEFHARVSRSGLSANAFLTRAWHGSDSSRRSRRPPVELQALARLLAEAAKLRAEFESAREAGQADEQLFEQACRDLTEIRAALMTLMGRKP